VTRTALIQQRSIQIKEHTMAAHGHATVWGTHLGVGHTAQGWYAQVKAWWAAHRDAKRAALNGQWDGRRETFRSFRADAAIDMAVSAHAPSINMALCDLGL
jgi:hypothetical protein